MTATAETLLQELRELERRYAMPTYARAPVAFVRGEGHWLWDAEGKRYLDFLGGLSVTSAGHANPAIVAAVREQIGRLEHVSNLYYSEPALRLSARLSESSLGGKVFLCNSGAEANECAIKLARKHAHDRGISDPEIVVLTGAFHGRTMGSLAATPQEAKQAPFAPMLGGFLAVARDDPASVVAAVGERTAAVVLEPVQGESGVHIVPDSVLVAAREACDRTGALLVFDEIQCGMGRTGSLWAYQQTPVRPDLMTSAKALGGGLPLGACVSGPAHGDVLGAGDHGSTFGGGPVTASAALAALDVIDRPELLRSARELGSRFAEGLESLPGIAEVRCRGLMVGADLTGGLAAELVGRALEKGLVLNATGPATLRFLPPLTIGHPEVGLALEILGDLLRGV